MPIEIFICYAHEDELLRQGLVKQLRVLKRQCLIDIWHDRNISGGLEWEREVDRHLNSSQIILLLVSPDFIDSDYCYGIEMKRAMERHESGEARVIPIILRHVHWHKTPFGKLQALPTDAKPVKAWRNQDKAFYDVAEGIRKVAEEFSTHSMKDLPKLGEQEVTEPINMEEPSNSSDSKDDLAMTLGEELTFTEDGDVLMTLPSIPLIVFDAFTTPDLPQASSPLTLEQVRQRWGNAKMLVKGKNSSGIKIAAYLNDYSIVGVEDAANEPTIVIQATHAPHYKYLVESTYLQDIEWALSTEFGRKCFVRLWPPGQLYVPIITIEQILEAWERIKRRTKGKGVLGLKLSALLNDFTVKLVDNTFFVPVVTLQATHNLHYKFIAQPEYRETIEWAFSVEFGQQFIVQLLPPS